MNPRRSSPTQCIVRLATFVSSVLLGTLSVSGCAGEAQRGASLALAEALAPVAQEITTRADRYSTLAAHRRQELERLTAYAKAGEFPRNHSERPTLHMFKDEAGRRCAIAHLIHLDGHDEVVDRYARTKNDVVVIDETRGELRDWVLTSGLTADEVDRIQKPAPMVMRPPPRPVVVAPPATTPPVVVAAASARLEPVVPTPLSIEAMTEARRAYLLSVIGELEDESASARALSRAVEASFDEETRDGARDRA